MFSRTDREDTRTIIAHTLAKKTEDLGFIQPIAEIIDGKLKPITPSNFCETGIVFITKEFLALENKYPNNKFFQIKINISDTFGTEKFNTGSDCKYVAIPDSAMDIRPRDYFEIVESKLPPADLRVIHTNSLPGTTFIFIKDGEAMYGPFKWLNASRNDTKDLIEIDFIDTHLPRVDLLPYQCYKIHNNKLSKYITKSSGSKKLIMQHLDVVSEAEIFDFSSDDEIVRFFTKTAADQKIRILDRKAADGLAKFIRDTPKIKTNSDFYRSRLQRFVEITKISNKAQEEIKDSIVNFIKNSDVGNDIVKNYISQNENSILIQFKKEKQAEIESELEKRKIELEDSENRLKELEQKKKNLYSEIQSLQADSSSSEEKKETDITSIYAKTDELVAEQQKKLSALQRQIGEYENGCELNSIVKKLKDDVAYYERRETEVKQKTKEAEEIQQKINKQLEEDTAKLQARLIDLKPFVDAINGTFSLEMEKQKSLSIRTKLVEKINVIDKQKYVVSSMQSSLEKKGRYFSEHQIANLLITTQQSFLTFFAGLPGTGKTSLARLIADAQNINLRFNEVAVSRGWTSQKDLIGYYNPLINRFQAASTGMYSFLKSIYYEGNHKDQAMAYILLDEANLSPIEHYWSSFMGISDPEGRKHLLLGNEEIDIPNNLRFIATINYDATTEPLSPRLISRAPVIVLENSEETKQIGQLDNDIVDNFLPAPSHQMEELFGLSKNIPEFNSTEQIVYKNIINILQEKNIELGRPIFVSPRKENAVRQYLQKARDLMSIDKDLTAFDFAVQQYILPLIQGNGGKFGKRLDSLKNILEANELIGSTNTLERIIAFGQSDLHTYDFFCW